MLERSQWVPVGAGASASGHQWVLPTSWDILVLVCASLDCREMFTIKTFEIKQSLSLPECQGRLLASQTENRK